jgi:hypothetical protein
VPSELELHACPIAARWLELCGLEHLAEATREGLGEGRVETEAVLGQAAVLAEVEGYRARSAPAGIRQQHLVHCTEASVLLDALP